MLFLKLYNERVYFHSVLVDQGHHIATFEPKLRLVHPLVHLRHLNSLLAAFACLSLIL